MKFFQSYSTLNSETPSSAKEKPSVAKARGRINRWALFGLIIVLAVFTVLEVSNVIAINRLLKENRQLEGKVDSLRNVQSDLQAKSSELQSADRIVPMAQSKLGLVPMNSAPRVIWLKKERE